MSDTHDAGCGCGKADAGIEYNTGQITDEQILAAVGEALDSLRAAAVEPDPRDAQIEALMAQVSSFEKRFEAMDADKLINELVSE